MIAHFGRGADAARTLSAIAELAGCSRREVEAYVQSARLAGVPIVSGSEGVWIATTPQEAQEAADRLRTRAMHQLETSAALRRAADLMEPVAQTSWLDAA